MRPHTTEEVRAELERLGGWDNPESGEKMHELIHLSDALSEIRETLGPPNDDSDVP
jgi:hypothetical protein